MTINFDEMKMIDVWNEIDRKLNSEPGPIEGMNTVYGFNLSGDDGGLFGLKIINGTAEAVAEYLGEVDCALSMSVNDFKKLLAGNLNATASYMMGKLKVKGSLGQALKLESLLKKYTF